MLTSRRRAVAVGSALAVLLAAGAAHLRVTRPAPVTAVQAVERFQAEVEQERRPPPGPPPAGLGATSGAPDAAPAERATTGTVLDDAAPGRPVIPSTRRPSAPASGALTHGRLRPPQGVYAYATQGEEGVGVYSRTFGPESFRTVVHRRGGGWTDHHAFSDDRESWGTFSLGRHRRVLHSQRNRVVLGPVTKDVTITFTPPLEATVLPWRAGRTWDGPVSGRASGSDDGEVAGTLRGRTLALTSLRIAGEDVPTWVDRLQLVLRGAVEGTVDVTRWLSPENGLTVREEYEADVALGGGFTYRARWTVQLRSLQPRR